MLRFWMVAHPENDRMWLTPPYDYLPTWTVDEGIAERFTDEDRALNAMIERTNGKGRAIECICPMVAA
jgi:hypothetical protein